MISIQTQAAGADAPASVKVGLYGASGSTGAELVSQLRYHPWAELCFATSRSHAGKSLRQLDPGAPDLKLCAQEDARPEDVEVVFLCLPHGTTAPFAESCLKAGARVVDLSGDLRLRAEDLHAEVYGTPRSQAVADQAVYGLTEHARTGLHGARLVSNPGCYPTCVLLALAPLARKKMLRGPVFIDAKSGLSGAGRSASPHTLLSTATDNVRPYKLGRSHRHVPEIEQALSRLSGQPAPRVIFNPHTLPIERGMLATLVVQVPPIPLEALHVLYRDAYAQEPFVELLPPGEAAQIRMVTRSNSAVIGLHPIEGTEFITISCAIDNLGKGAAGQAIQNLNAMMGWPETTGLLPEMAA